MRINRATPRTQSALLEAMQERTVTVANVAHAVPLPFFVLATQNPIELEGTYPLPEAELDRFFFKLQVGYPSREQLGEIFRRTTGAERSSVEPVADGERLLWLQDRVREVPIASYLLDYAARLVLATHPDQAGARSWRAGSYGTGRVRARARRSFSPRRSARCSAVVSTCRLPTCARWPRRRCVIA